MGKTKSGGEPLRVAPDGPRGTRRRKSTARTAGPDGADLGDGSPPSTNAITTLLDAREAGPELLEAFQRCEAAMPPGQWELRGVYPVQRGGWQALAEDILHGWVTGASLVLDDPIAALDELTAQVAPVTAWILVQAGRRPEEPFGVTGDDEVVIPDAMPELALTDRIRRQDLLERIWAEARAARESGETAPSETQADYAELMAMDRLVAARRANAR